MTFAQAFTDDVRDFSSSELHAARGVIGNRKLWRRQQSSVDWTKFPNGGGRDASDLREILAGMNRRLDSINGEENKRQLAGKTR